MTLHISPDIEQMASQLALITGHSAEEELREALRIRYVTLHKQTSSKSAKPLRERVKAIQRDFAALPVLDNRTPEEIVGYDVHGLPTQ